MRSDYLSKSITLSGLPLQIVPHALHISVCLCACVVILDTHPFLLICLRYLIRPLLALSIFTHYLQLGHNDQIVCMHVFMHLAIYIGLHIHIM